MEKINVKKGIDGMRLIGYASNGNSIREFTKQGEEFLGFALEAAREKMERISKKKKRARK